MTPDIKRTTLRLPSKLYETAEKEAKKIGVSLNGFICVALGELVAKKKSKN